MISRRTSELCGKLEMPSQLRAAGHRATKQNAFQSKFGPTRIGNQKLYNNSRNVRRPA